MSRLKRCEYVLWIAALTWSVGAAVMAQSPDPPSAAGDAVNPLVAKEEMIQERLTRLEDRMFRLRESLVEQEPENADRLAAALERSGEMGIKHRVDTILELLGDSSRLNEAGEMQEKLIEDLEIILRSLTEKVTDDEDRDRRIEELEDAKARAEELQEEQRSLRSETADSIEKRRKAAQLREAIKRLDEIIRRQSEAEKESERTGAKEAAEHKRLSEAQSAIAKDTKRLAERIKSMNKSADPKSGDSSGDGSESDGDSKSGEGAGEKSQGGESKSMEEASADLQAAQEEMGEAQSDLNKGDPAAAAKDQKKASEDLRRARHKLAEALKELSDESVKDKLADAQRELSEKAQALGKKLGGEKQSGQQGGKQGGKQGGEKGGEKGGKQPPGQEQVEKAQKHMEDATDDLEKDETRDATEDQDKALAELGDAIAELEEVLRQLRQEEQEEVLRDLESRFRAMLVTQLEINAGTTDLHTIGADNFGRAEHLRAAELAESENGLGRDASKALHVLEEEGTTIVFPAILRQLSEDMLSVAVRLEQLNVGLLTQTMEEEIVDTLKNLVEAIEEKQRQMESQSGQGQPSSKDQPLLPTSAELKLLRSLQVRVYDRTGAIQKERASGTEGEASLRKATEAVTGRQIEAAEIAAEMNELESGS